MSEHDAATGRRLLSFFNPDFIPSNQSTTLLPFYFVILLLIYFFPLDVIS